AGRLAVHDAVEGVEVGQRVDRGLVKRRHQRGAFAQRRQGGLRRLRVRHGGDSLRKVPAALCRKSWPASITRRGTRETGRLTTRSAPAGPPATRPGACRRGPRAGPDGRRGRGPRRREPVPQGGGGGTTGRRPTARRGRKRTAGS